MPTVPRWLFPSLHGYRKGWLRGDLIAGLTVWAVLVPEALAYSSIAGVSPVIGLYAAPGALLLYAAFGSSRHLIVGPMSATAALSAATVGEYAAGGSGQFAALTAALAISVGMAALIAGLLRLDFLANFISEPVQKGFIVGLALTIIIGQLPDLFGVSKGSGDFFQKLWHLIVNLGHTQVLTLVVGLASLAIVLGLGRVAPAVPGSLVAVAAFPAIVRLYRVYSGRLGRAYGVAARPDFIGAVAALLGVTIFDTLPGPFIGIGVSLTLLLYWSSRPRVATLGEVPGSAGEYRDVEGHPEYPIPDGVAIRRVESGLFFASADRVRQTLREAAALPGVHAVVLDAATVPYVDVSAAEMLAQSAEELSSRGARLIVAGQIGEVRDVIRATGVSTELQGYPDLPSAVAAASADARGTPGTAGAPAT